MIHKVILDKNIYWMQKAVPETDSVQNSGSAQTGSPAQEVAAAVWSRCEGDCGVQKVRDWNLHRPIETTGPPENQKSRVKEMTHPTMKTNITQTQILLDFFPSINI